jgi:hypothetical protein
MEKDVLVLSIMALLGIILAVVFEYRSRRTSYLITRKKKCSCGKYNACIRQPKVKRSGSVYIDKIDQFRCGKIQDQIKEMQEYFKDCIPPEKNTENGNN